MTQQDDHIDYNNTVIEIKGLKKSFGSNHVLQGIDLQIFKGENIVILGRSGTGKSVLIKIIAGLLKPDEGYVKVMGKNVAELNNAELEQLRLKLGFSFQSSALYDSMTVRENLAFPLQRSGKKVGSEDLGKSIEKALDDVGLSKTIDQMPSELSGGQRKRIGIARTLIMQPEIMLYDEPTAGLDPITSQEINDLINQVQERYHTTSVIITHDLTCAKETGNRIAVLMEGKFLHEGTFKEVFEHPDDRIKSFYDYNFIST